MVSVISEPETGLGNISPAGDKACRFELPPEPCKLEFKVEPVARASQGPSLAAISVIESLAKSFGGDKFQTVFPDVSDFGIISKLFPVGLPIVRDETGSVWIVDLMSPSAGWGPIFQVCDDPIAYRYANILEFAQAASAADAAYHGGFPHPNDLAADIWLNNPNVKKYKDCLESRDNTLMEFAQSLGSSYQIVDLRNPKLGDGFSWGRFGRDTVVKRSEEARIFAYQVRGTNIRRREIASN